MSISAGTKLNLISINPVRAKIKSTATNNIKQYHNDIQTSINFTALIHVSVQGLSSHNWSNANMVCIALQIT